MAGTADDLSTFPLDSPNWVLIHDVIGSLSRLTAARRLAAHDLIAKLRTEAVHSMRRCGLEHGQLSGLDGKTLRFGDCELLTRSFWAEHDLGAWSDRTFVRCSHRACWNQFFIFYVWGPDLARVWPTVFPPVPQPSVLAASNPQPKEEERGQPLRLSEEPQLEPPRLQPPTGRTTAAAWIPYLTKRYPREEGEKTGDYIERILEHAPKRWSPHTVANILSELKQEPD
jgi:hypothetical protein